MVLPRLGLSTHRVVGVERVIRAHRPVGVVLARRRILPRALSRVTFAVQSIGTESTGRRGRPDAGLLLDVLEQRPALTAPHAYACGATELLDETRSALVRLGLPAGRIQRPPAGTSRLTTVRH